eukprot:2388713-Pleurochrysis_carterae.AAC.1
MWARCDARLSALLKSGRVRVGSKLRICGASKEPEGDEDAEGGDGGSGAGGGGGGGGGGGEGGGGGGG